MHYVYVLQDSLNARLYIGRSDDLKRRLREHAAGKVWTTKRMHNPRLVFYEAFQGKEDAIRRERYFKTSKGKSSLKQIIRVSLQNH